jgi:hypothetical protein
MASFRQPLSLRDAQVSCALRANPKLRLRRSTPYGSGKIWSAETKSPLWIRAERAQGFCEAKLRHLFQPYFGAVVALRVLEQIGVGYPLVRARHIRESQNA